MAPEAAYRYTLVVGEDSPERASLESILMRGGLEVAACSEQELLPMSDLMPPQLVIFLDASSYEQRMASFARIIAHPRLVGVPIVVIANDADIDSFSTAITHGASAYLVKPVAPDEVVKVAHKISGWLASNDRTERRRRLRRPLLMRVDVAAAGRAPVPGQIVDVSSTGCRIELEGRLAVGEPLRITLHGVQGSTDLTLSAEVRWRREAPDGKDLAGVKFKGTAALIAGRLLGAASEING